MNDIENNAEKEAIRAISFGGIDTAIVLALLSLFCVVVLAVGMPRPVHVGQESIGSVLAPLLQTLGLSMPFFALLSFILGMSRIK